MKKLIFLIVILVIVFKSQAQKIDWVNAPMNPIALKFKKEHFNLKGDVYAYGQKVFSKEGMLIYEFSLSRGLHYLYKNGVLYADTEGKSYEFNSQGYLVKYTYASLGIQTQRYIYNAKGLLTNLSNTKGYNVAYTYDEKGRLIKSITGGTIKEFSYLKNGDQLIVTEKDLSTNPAAITKYIYKNGLEIGRNDKLFNLKYDKLGNKVGFENAIYYNDVDRTNNDISVIYTKSTYASSDPLFNCKFYINEQKADFLFKEVLQRKDIIIYNPFSEKYYIIENAFDDAKSAQKQVFAKVLVNSPYTLLLRKGSSPMLGYRGAFLGNTTNGMRNGALKVYNAPVYLVYDKILNQTFYGDLDLANTSGYYPLQPISPQDNVVYLKTGDNIFVVVIEGKQNAKENPTHKLINLQNGDGVIKDENGNPLYYLPGTAKATLNKLYAGKKYNPATDKLELASNTPTSPTSSKTNAVEINKSPAVPINSTPTSSVKTNNAGTQSRLYNGKYTKETALVAINKYIDNLKKIGSYSFVGGATKTYQIDGIWTQKITEQDKGIVNIRYIIGDNGLTIELINAMLDKNGKAIMIYSQSPNETIKKLYNNQVGMYVEGLFSYLGINDNVPITTKTSTVNSNHTVQNNTNIANSTVNNADPYSGLSAEAGAYMAAYRTNLNGLKSYMENQLKSWEQKGYAAEKIIQSCTAMFKEVYTKSPDAAFELLMKLPQRVALIKLLPNLTVEQRDFVRKKSKERLQKYSGAYSNKTN
ncbi:MAG: RHS repeat protein [Sphingobacteriales bacterium]|nr:RHS repeat protein [Sphingobacteriales bacterium]